MKVAIKSSQSPGLYKFIVSVFIARTSRTILLHYLTPESEIMQGKLVEKERSLIETLIFYYVPLILTQLQMALHLKH